MKNYFVIILLFSIVSACNNSEPNTTTESNTEKVAHDHDGPDHSEHDHDHDHAGHNHDAPKHHKSSPLSPYIGIWECRATTHQPDYYKGRWIDFKGDGTFISGSGAMQTNSGTWTIGGEKKIIDLSYKDKSVNADEQWKTLVNSSAIIFIGNTPKNKTGGQMKWSKIETRPTE